MSAEQIGPPIPPDPLEIARGIIKDSGLPPEQIIADLLTNIHLLQEQLGAEAQLLSLKPLITQQDKMAVVTHHVMEAANILHRGFHMSDATTELSSRIRFGDGEYNIKFGKVLIIDPKSLS